MTAALSNHRMKLSSLRRRLGRRSIGLGVLLVVLMGLAFALNPVRVEYQLWRGRAELLRGNPSAAQVHFHHAERISPDKAETHFWLARTSRKAGDLEGVRRHLDEAQRLGYRDRDHLRREWWLVLAEAGHIRETEPFLAEMLTHPGEDGREICDAFATGYCMNLRFEEALALLDAWQADYPNDYRPHLRRGHIYAGNEQWTVAEAAFREAFRLAPDELDVHRGLARALMGLGKTDEAEHHLRIVLDREPTDADSLIKLARILRDRKEYTEAIALIRRVLDWEPENFDARLSLAKLLLAAGDAAEAVRQAGPLVELWPQDLESRYVLGNALRAAGRMKEAESHFRVHTELQRNWERLEELKRLVKQRPSDPELRYELGLLLLRHTNPRSEGVAWLQSVFQFEPDHQGAHRALAEHYEKIGQRELARRHRNPRSTAQSDLASGKDVIPSPLGDPPQ